MMRELVRVSMLGRTKQHQLLVLALQARQRLAEAARPRETLARKLRAKTSPNPQLVFQAYARWPRDVSEALLRLPYGFINSEDLDAESVAWLFEHTLAQRPAELLEVGCGASTLVLGAAVERLTDALGGPKLVTLSSEREWLAAVREALSVVPITVRPELRAAPSNGDRSALADLASVESVLVTASNQRELDTLPAGLEQLRPATPIVMGHAALPGRRELVRAWQNDGLARLEDYVTVGRGIALLRKA